MTIQMIWDRRTVPPLVAVMIARIEKFVSHAYWDPIGKCWTYGFGFTRRPDGNAVRSNDAITLPQAQQYLTILLAKHTATICAAVSAPISIVTAAVLFDFLHEEGDRDLAGSMVAKALQAGDLVAFGEHLMGWIVGGGKPELGIARRREYERLQAVEAMVEAAAYTQAWRMTDAAMMVAYNNAFKVARAAGWNPAQTVHAGTPSGKPTASVPPPTAETTDDLNGDQIASLQGATT